MWHWRPPQVSHADGRRDLVGERPSFIMQAHQDAIPEDREEEQQAEDEAAAEDAGASVDGVALQMERSHLLGEPDLEAID